MGLCGTLFQITLFLGLVIFPIVFFVDQQLDQHFIFTPDELNQVAQAAIKKHGNNTQALIRDIANKLDKKHPGHILLEERWMFNNAGGAMGSMWILHASVTEYVIIFGTPIGTTGHTGRYFADDYFYILEGEQWAFRAGDLEKKVFKVGDMHHLPRGQAEGYRIPEKTWALEYARGWIPAMFPFGTIEVICSTMDFHTFWTLVDVYGRSLIKELSQGKF